MQLLPRAMLSKATFAPPLTGKTEMRAGGGGLETNKHTVGAQLEGCAPTWFVHLGSNRCLLFKF